MLKCNGKDINGATVCISGAGNVAIYATQKATELGAKVVTLSDSTGWVYDAEGIDLDAVKEIKEVAFCVVGRLLIAPFLTLGGAILIGIRGIPLASIMAMTITPCAVASFAMAQQMDSDGELAGNALVFTTIFSALTMFLWVYVLKEIGVL